jgi:hypothetical protein
MLAVGGARSGSDDRGSTAGHVVEAALAERPESQRRMGLRPFPVIDTRERGEGKIGPFVIVGGDQATATAAQ